MPQCALRRPQQEIGELCGLMVMLSFRRRELINPKIQNRHHFATRSARLVVAYGVLCPGLEESRAAIADSIRSTAW